VKRGHRLLDVLIWTALAASVVVLVRRRSSGPDEGSDAAQVKLPLVGQSGHFDLASLRGKPVVMEVFASWCGTCRRATPVLAQAYREHASDRVAFVGVSVDDSLADAERAREKWQIPYPVALDDGQVSRAYNVSLLPTVVLIDRDGKIHRSSAGVPSREELDRFIAAN